MISKGRKDYISYLCWGEGITLRSLLLMKTLSAYAKKKKKANESYQFKVNGIYYFKVMAYQAVPTKVTN